MPALLPISAIIPTRNRSQSLARTLHSLAQQSAQPLEAIVIDGSTNEETQQLCHSIIPNLYTKIIYQKAAEIGAASQRNQGIAFASQTTIWLLDDDIIFEPECLARLWLALQSEPNLGGVNAMITNLRYLPPSKISRFVFQFLSDSSADSYAGKCIGPGVNLLPEDRDDLLEVVPVEWLNTGCTLYRKEALPDPPFPSHFTGYSLMEDLTLSLIVGRQWHLANARTARVFHDNRPEDNKKNVMVLAKMELVNRHYVMTSVLKKQQPQDYFKLLVWELFIIAANLQSIKGWLFLPKLLVGKVSGLREIIFSSRGENMNH